MLIGLDTNIVCYALDPAFKEHKKAKSAVVKAARSAERITLNPTVIHETYHTLVYRQRWIPEDARSKILAFLRHPHVIFQGQTKKISLLALRLAVSYKLGGRDSLILANLLDNKTDKLYTHDTDLIRLKRVSMDTRTLVIEDPVKKFEAR